MGDFDLIDASERSLIDLLLRRDLISHQSLTEALEYQCRLPHSSYMTLDQILVDMEYLSPRDLANAQHLLGHGEEADAASSRRSQLPTAAEAKPLNLQALFDPQASHDAPLDLQALFNPEADPGAPLDLQALFNPTADPGAPLDLQALFDPTADQGLPLDLHGLFNPEVMLPEPVVPPLAPPPPMTPPAMVEPEFVVPAAVIEPEAVPEPPPAPPAPVAAPPQGLRAAGAFAQRSMQPMAGNWGGAPSSTRPSMPVVSPMSSTIPLQPLPDPKLPRSQLGEILIKNHDLEEWQLTHALCIQRAAPQTSPKLGTLLVRLGYAEAQAVERALGSQKP